MTKVRTIELSDNSELFGFLLETNKLEDLKRPRLLVLLECWPILLCNVWCILEVHLNKLQNVLKLSFAGMV